MIDLSNLMIGDWYTALDYNKVRRPFQVELNDFAEKADGYDYDKITQPKYLPITEEILNANDINMGRTIIPSEGGASRGTEIWILQNTIGSDDSPALYEVSIRHDDSGLNRGGRMHMYISFIHELQHLLHDVGLHDMAHDFKVEEL